MAEAQRPPKPKGIHDWIEGRWVKRPSAAQIYAAERAREQERLNSCLRNTLDNPYFNPKRASDNRYSGKELVKAYVDRADINWDAVAKLLEAIRRIEHPDRGGDPRIAASINKLLAKGSEE